jgi:hypothetical protein
MMPGSRYAKAIMISVTAIIVFGLVLAAVAFPMTY